MKMIDELGNFIDDIEALNYKFLKFQDDKMIMRKVSQEELDEQKLFELTNWFDNYFDKQLNQSLWQDDFTVSHDNYFNKDYASIDELKAQAKIVRNEIRELRVNKFNTSLSKKNNDENNKTIQNDSVI